MAEVPPTHPIKGAMHTVVATQFVRGIGYVAVVPPPEQAAAGFVDGSELPIGLQEYQLYVTGKTPPLTYSGDYHCRPKSLVAGKQVPCTYEVWLTADTLNDETFIVDNALVISYFDSWSHITESCEELATKAAATLLSMFPNLTSAKVRLWGIDGAAYAQVILRRG